MNATAYLIVFINTRTHVIREAGVYSEPARTLSRLLTDRHCPADLLKAEGRTYEEARHNVIRTARNDPQFTWVIELLPAADRVMPRKSVPP